jgi:LacI family transcriptional regulator
VAVSINDVASAAGVSKSTVSQVLNGNSQARIKIETQENIRRIAQELGYRPNRMARSLGRRRTDTIGLMVFGLRNPFFIELAETAERMVQEAGYQAVIDAATPLGAYHKPGMLHDWPVDGVLMWANSYQSLSDYLGPQAEHIPVVYQGAIERQDGSDAVGHNACEGARRLVEHLLAQGYRSIGQVMPHYFVDPRFDDERPRTYAEVCRQADVPLETILLRDHHSLRAASVEVGVELAARPASKRPRALLCHNDVVAIGVIQGLRRSGVRVPEDVAVAGFDGIEEGQHLDTPLTTVRIPVEEICRRSLDILLLRLHSEVQLPTQRILIPTTEIAVGKTT